MATETYKLLYFNGRGAAERIRFLFAIGKIEFEDTRWNFDEFKEGKATGAFAANLGRLPILEVASAGGKPVQIAQSKSIERYLAKKIGLYGTTPLEEALIDAICEHQRDLRDSYKKIDDLKKEEHPDKDEKYKAWFEKDLLEYLEKFEVALPEDSKDGPFLTGPRLTLADIAWTQFLCDYLDGGGWSGEKAAVEAALAIAPRLKAATAAVLAHPEIAAYLSARPKEQMF